VALTAYARPEDGIRALAAGFQLHIPKPGPSDMPTILANLVKAARKSDASPSA
jgi:CheY-like chemotaxis protein